MEQYGHEKVQHIVKKEGRLPKSKSIYEYKE
jgi:hypothetical protein